jgi:Rrf2 family protein
MKRDSKLSVALHILTHLAAAGDRPIISDVMASHLRTNPVVIRRSLAGLRNAGIVASVKGHGGGWTLARPAASISLGEVYAAIGEPADLLPDVEPDPDGCRVVAVVRGALDEVYGEAIALFRRRLDAITLDDLTADVTRQLGASGADVQANDVLSAWPITQESPSLQPRNHASL